MNLRFDLDPCGPRNADAPSRAWCDRVVTAPDDGLDADWAGRRVWLNAPYSNIGEWVHHLLNAPCTGITISYIRAEVEWCQRLLRHAGGVLFLNRRVKFIPGGGQRESSPGGPSILCAVGELESAALRRMAAEGHGVYR
jgi:hypothetical protein